MLSCNNFYFIPCPDLQKCSKMCPVIHFDLGFQVMGIPSLIAFLKRVRESMFISNPFPHVSDRMVGSNNQYSPLKRLVQLQVRINVPRHGINDRLFFGIVASFNLSLKLKVVFKNGPSPASFSVSFQYIHPNCNLPM